MREFLLQIDHCYEASVEATLSLASVASTAGFNPPQPCTQKTFAQAAQAAQSSSSERSKGSPQQSERDQNVILFQGRTTTRSAAWAAVEENKCALWLWTIQGKRPLPRPK